jgi:hypothetical protein
MHLNGSSHAWRWFPAFNFQRPMKTTKEKRWLASTNVSLDCYSSIAVLGKMLEKTKHFRTGVTYYSIFTNIDFEVITEVAMKTCLLLLPASCLILARPEDGGNVFLRNVNRLSADYKALYPRWQNTCSKFSVVRFWLCFCIIQTYKEMLIGSNLSI